MRRILAVTLLSSTFSFPIFAADNGFYSKIGFGKSSNVRSVDNSGSYDFSLGYQINRQWGVEGGYTSLFSDAAINTGVAGQTGKYKASAVTIAAVYTYPVSDQFSVLGRLGVHNSTESVTGSVGTFSSAGSNTNSGVLYGLADQYNFFENGGIRIGYDFYNSNINGSNGTIRNLNFSLIAKIK